MNEETDFFNYMMDKKLFKTRKTYHDYISRLRYVSGLFKLDKDIDEEKIAYILDQLRKTSNERDKYNSKKGISDIGAGLKRFLEYAKSDYAKIQEETILAEEDSIKSSTTIGETEKTALIKSRIGQGSFRTNLFSYWKGCSVTGCQSFAFLVASHIKPWRSSTNKERLDLFNGLLLVPNLDKLFDRGYISFSDKGQIIISSCFPESDRKILCVDDTVGLIKISQEHVAYLRYHRENCFL